MITGRVLTEAEKECLAKEIRQFLLDNGLWVDTTIYFNGKASSTSDRCGHYYYNDPDHLIVLENQDPREYFEYVSDDDILSMSFEGEFLHCMRMESVHGRKYDEQIYLQFESILDNYDVYFTFGHHWNLTCYYKWK